MLLHRRKSFRWGGVPTNGLLTNNISCYEFENDATDETGSFDGTASNVSYSTGTVKLGTYSSSYNDSNSYIDLNDKFDFIHKTGDFAISVRMKLNNYNADDANGIVVNNAGSSSNYWVSWFYDNRTSQGSPHRLRLYVTHGPGTNYNVQHDSAIGDNNWHHIVVEGDGTDINFWVDGSNVKTSSSVVLTTSTAATNNLWVSAFNTATTLPMNWYFDQMAMRDASLGSTKIADLYNSGSGLLYSSRD